MLPGFHTETAEAATSSCSACAARWPGGTCRRRCTSWAAPSAVAGAHSRLHLAEPRGAAIGPPRARDGATPSHLARRRRDGVDARERHQCVPLARAHQRPDGARRAGRRGGAGRAARRRGEQRRGRRRRRWPSSAALGSVACTWKLKLVRRPCRRGRARGAHAAGRCARPAPRLDANQAWSHAQADAFCARSVHLTDGGRAPGSGGAATPATPLANVSPLRVAASRARILRGAAQGRRRRPGSARPLRRTAARPR